LVVSSSGALPAAKSMKKKSVLRDRRATGGHLDRERGAKLL